MSIWDLLELQNLPEHTNKLTLGEGNTPVQHVEVDGMSIAFKREDLNPTGSYKDRGTAYKISRLYSDGVKELVMTTSGNAAISFLTYAQLTDIKLHIVISPNINKSKQQLINQLIDKTNHKLYLASNAKSKAAQISAELKIPNLKSSIDSDLPIGYSSIGLELTSGSYSDLFLCTSSGTGLYGISLGIGKSTRLHCCQTTAIHSIADYFDDKFTDTINSIADAVVDGSALRREQTINTINQSSGSGWVLSDEEINEAQQLIEEISEIRLSTNSALAFAGLLKAKRSGWKLTNPICIVSGR